MSTTTQRPTPETDDAARKGAYLTHGKYPETCGKQIVHIDFARKLERERDEARECCDMQAEMLACQAKRNAELQQQLEAMREAIKDIYCLTEGCADGAPDASAHDKLCNEIADKLQPFIK